MTQNKLIVFLILIILIFGGILALKMTGIIKTTEKPLNTTNTSSTNNSTINKYENAISSSSTNKNYNSSYDIDSSDIDSAFSKALRNWERNILIISIVTTIISIALTIGTCKLYAKLGMPSWTIKLTFLNAFLPLIFSFSTSGALNYLFSAIEIILSLLSFGVFYHYFVAVGMPGWIPFLAILAIIPFVGFIVVLGLLVAYVISNIKLANIFNKGIAFKIGLIFLPFIFQPILGYQNT